MSQFIIIRNIGVEMMNKYIDDRYDLAGFYIRKPSFVHMQRKVETQLIELMEHENYNPVLFPTLIPKDVIEREVHHIKGFEPAVYWVEKYGFNNFMDIPAALAISSETVFCQTYSRWLKDGEQLPLKFYQIRNVFRSENENVEALIREKEFMWMEAHTAFSSKEDCRIQIEHDIEIVKNFFSKYDISVTAEKRNEEDKCPGAIDTYGMDVYSPKGVIQVASTHYLGQRFSSVFGLYMDGQALYQTSFGIGISRLIGVLLYCEKI